MTTQEATITHISDEGTTTTNGETLPYQQLELSTADGTMTILNAQQPFARWTPYRAGQQVVLTQQPDASWLITDFVRRPALTQLGVLFTLLVVLIGRWWGVRSLVSLAISFAIIFGLILPLIIQGFNPLLVTLAGALLIIPGTFYLSHGWHPKTHAAVIGTLIALTISGLLAVSFVNSAHLTGFADESAGFLSVETQDAIDIRGLLLAGIIISLLGTLDDITVSQASFVQQLKEANPKISFRELFVRGMRVGQDHISSLVNTLILVYTGASFPLLLLFLDAQMPVAQLLNLEMIADEVVRTLVGSIGVVLAAPITTLIAATFFSKAKNATKEATHVH
jgi:uncharacterized membrane protein